MKKTVWNSDEYYMTFEAEDMLLPYSLITLVDSRIARVE